MVWNADRRIPQFRMQTVQGAPFHRPRSTSEQCQDATLCQGKNLTQPSDRKRGDAEEPIVLEGHVGNFEGPHS